MAFNSTFLTSMHPPIYDYGTQYAIGKKGEQVLDRWLQSVYQIQDVSNDPKYQQAGIDRIATRPNGSVLTVEYKCDCTAKTTGNLFFETISIDNKGIEGWGWTSQADYWIFLIPDREILVIQPGKLRSLVWRDCQHLPEKSVRNRNYKTLGLAIPLHQVEKIARFVHKLYLDGL